MKKIAIIFVAALLGGITSIGVYKIFEDNEMNISPSKENAATKLVNLIDGSPDMNVDYVTAAEMTVNAVVHVKVEGTREFTQQGFDPFKEFFYGNGNVEKKYSQPVKGAGSGVIISEDGYIVTNNHVVESSNKISVTLNNSKTYTASVVGLDPTTDLALLKIDADNLPTINFANSDDARVGEWVLAVGNPYNLTSTVTAGIVSAKGRDIGILGNDPYTGLSSIESFIQTDAAVNPGNSGGALVNTKGELIGINAAIESNTGSYTGYSFAIPSNIVKKVVEDLKKYGSVQRAFIGINIRDIDEKLAEEKSLQEYDGVYVAGLTDNGSALAAGLKVGDIIKSIDGRKINNVTALQEKIGQKRPGDKIVMTVKRNNELIEKEVVLKNIEGNTEIVKDDKNLLFKELGVKLEEIDAETKSKLKIDNGVQVVELFPGKFRSTGMNKGFIIQKIDNNKVENIEDLTNLLQNKKGGVLIEGIYPNGQSAYYGFGL